MSLKDRLHHKFQDKIELTVKIGGDDTTWIIISKDEHLINLARAEILTELRRTVGFVKE